MSIFQKIVTILYKIDYDSSFKVFPTKLKKNIAHQIKNTL